MADYFPSAGKPAFTSRGKIAGPRHPPLRFGPSLRSGCRSGPPAAFRRHEGRDGRGRSDEGKHHDDRTRRHRLRAAAHLIPDRPRPRRTPALRLPPLPGRTRPETAARRPMPSPAPSPTSSTPSSPPWRTPASNPTSKTCSGRPSISSTAPSTGSSANSTTTSRRRSAARRSRTAPKSARSNSNASPPKGRR